MSRALALSVAWSVAAGAAVGFGRPVVAIALVTALGVVMYVLLSAPRGPPPRRHVAHADDDRDWLRGLLEGLSEGVVAFDRQGRVVFANASACALLGRRDLPDGTPMVAFSDVPRFRSSVVGALRGTPVSREIEFAGPPRRSLLLRASPAPQGAVAVLLDVSSVRRMEQSWRDFASNTSHELRTPATAILTSLEAVAEADDAPDEVRRRLLDAALRQSRRLARLVSDLLDLVRIEAGVDGADPEPVDVADVIGGCVDEVAMAHPGFREQVALGIRERPVVLGDGQALRRIVSNLLANAVRYAPGPLAIEVACRGPWVRIEVRDEGPGVPEEARDLVFERFYRVDAGRSREAGGTGLGLSIVRELAVGLGGRVGVDDNEPAGAVFWVELPRVRSGSSEGDEPRLTMDP